MSTLVLQTVAAVNYLPSVLVLAESIGEHLPAARLSVLLTDATPAAISRICERFGDCAEFFGCGDLETEYLDAMRSYYNILEFNSACKVLAIDYQIRTREQANCLFIDPDMFALGDFATAAQALGSDIVLSPHALAPYPEDNELPTEMELAVTGQINGGFVFVRNTESAARAMKWLLHKTRHDWFVAPNYGMYADQQWLSFLPQFFADATALLRDPGINIAYWNLHERPLREAGGRIAVDSGGLQPARLFHFSGFALPSGGRLTRHTGRRFDAETERTLTGLIGSYEQRLSNAQAKVLDSGVSGDLAFSRDPLPARMRAAQQYWGNRFIEIAPPVGRFTRLGRVLDGLFS